LAAATVVAAPAALADVSSNEQWPTAASGTPSDAGVAVPIDYGDTGVTAKFTADQLACNRGQVRHTTQDAPTNATTFLRPTPPQGTLFLAQCVTKSVATKDTFTFSRDIDDPILHVTNLDTTQMRATAQASAGEAAPLVLLSGNDVMHTDGNLINSQPAKGVGRDGCEANDESNRSGRCGSFLFAGKVTTIDLQDTSASSATDGFNVSVSFPVLNVTTMFGQPNIEPGHVSTLAFSIANPPDSSGIVSPLDFAARLPNNLAIADGDPSVEQCGSSASVTDFGGGELKVGATGLSVHAASVEPGQTCVVTVNVTSDQAGDYTMAADSITSTVGNLIPEPGTDTLTVNSEPFVPQFRLEASSGGAIVLFTKYPDMATCAVSMVVDCFEFTDGAIVGSFDPLTLAADIEALLPQYPIEALNETPIGRVTNPCIDIPHFAVSPAVKEVFDGSTEPVLLTDGGCDNQTVEAEAGHGQVIGPGEDVTLPTPADLTAQQIQCNNALQSGLFGSGIKLTKTCYELLPTKNGKKVLRLIVDPPKVGDCLKFGVNPGSLKQICLSHHDKYTIAP
jgi:hypothetical protein